MDLPKEYAYNFFTRLEYWVYPQTEEAWFEPPRSKLEERSSLYHLNFLLQADVPGSCIKRTQKQLDKQYICHFSLS